MGEIKILYYALTLLVAIFLVLLSTSSFNNLGYSGRLAMPKVQTDPSNVRPISLSMILFSKSMVELPEQVKLNLRSISEAYGSIADLEISIQHLQAESSELPNSKSSYVNSARQEIKLVFGIENVCNAHIICLQTYEEIPSHVVYSLRTSLNLPVEGNFVNGLSQDEISKGRDLYMNLIKSEVLKFNEMIRDTYHMLDSSDKLYIEKVKKQLTSKDPAYYKDLYMNLFHLTSKMSLYKPDYFQWDFKVGVYAPIFIPIMFPMGAAIYHRIFIKSKAKIKTE